MLVPHEEDEIALDGITTDCVVGLHPHERVRKQPLVLDVKLRRDLSQAGRSDSLQDTTDYSRLQAEIISLLSFRKYRLIESAAEETAAMVLGIYSVVDGVEVLVKKPAALAPHPAQASVRIRRRQPNAVSTSTQSTDHTTRTVLFSTANAQLEIVRVHAQEWVCVTPEHHTAIQWVLSDREYKYPMGDAASVVPHVQSALSVRRYSNCEAAEWSVFRCLMKVTD